VIAGFNTSKTVYSYPQWKVETVLQGPTDSLPVECAWSTDGKAFVGATVDDKLLLWTLASSAAGSASRPESFQLAKPAGEGFGPVFGPDGKVWAVTGDLLAFGPADETGDRRRRFVSDGPTWTVVCFSPDGKRVAIGKEDGGVDILDVASGARLETVHYAAPPDVTPWVGRLLWARDGSWLAAGRLDGSSFLLRMGPTSLKREHEEKEAR
jgi:WD40 repeat protein